MKERQPHINKTQQARMTHTRAATASKERALCATLSSRSVAGPAGAGGASGPRKVRSSRRTAAAKANAAPQQHTSDAVLRKVSKDDVIEKSKGCGSKKVRSSRRTVAVQDKCCPTATHKRRLVHASEFAEVSYDEKSTRHKR